MSTPSTHTYKLPNFNMNLFATCVNPSCRLPWRALLVYGAVRTDKDPDVSQLFYKLLRSRNGTPYYWMRTHLPDVIVPVLNTVVLPRLRTSFEILARANGTPTEELDRAWEEVQLSVAKGGSNIGGHDACFVAAFLAVWP